VTAVATRRVWLEEVARGAGHYRVRAYDPPHEPVVHVYVREDDKVGCPGVWLENEYLRAYDIEVYLEPPQGDVPRYVVPPRDEDVDKCFTKHEILGGATALS